jgi:hypothetical protein
VINSEVTNWMIATYEAGDLITICAWCGRVEFDGEWLLAPRAGFDAIDALNTLSHSICPGCAAIPQPLDPLSPDPRSDPSSSYRSCRRAASCDLNATL